MARELVVRGHEVTVLAPWPRGGVSGGAVRGWDAGVPYRMVRHPRFVSTRWFVGWYGVFLKRLGGFDVMHAHDVYPTGWIAMRAGVGKVVMTSHGGDLNEGNVRIVKPGVEARCVAALEGAAGLISIGRFTEANFRRLSQRLPEVVTIPNGVNVQALSAGEARRVEGVGPGRFLLCLGRLHKRKGVDVLIRAMALVDGVDLVVVGEGDERAALERLAGEVGGGAAGRVRFLGQRGGAEKTWLLRNAHAVVMPSRGWEGFPLVVLEAGAASRGVIASRVAGLEDLVEDGVTGRLVAAEDAEALAGAIRESLVGDVAARWGRAAFERVPRYAWGKIAEEHEAFYRRVAGRAR